MNFKSYMKLGILSILVNLISVYNAVFGLWSIIMIIFAWFIVKNRDAAAKPAQDKKVLGLVQTVMLGIFIFMSTVMGGMAIYMLHYPVWNYFSSYMVLFIILAVIGLIIYYYFVIRLLMESVRVVKNKRISS